MNVGLFFTGGYTEVAGLQTFLEKIPGVRCTRRLPFGLKPAPKLGRAAPAPHPDHAGLTGRALVERMLALLRQHPTEDDAYVVVDDADCRFCGHEGPREHALWVADVRDRVRQVTGRDVPVIVLLACQEIESWLLADFNETFEHRYPDVAHRLRLEVTALLQGTMDLETFGCPAQRRGGCSTKPSTWLRDQIEAHPDHRYSKQTDGGAMLRRARPDAVALRCTTYFRPAYLELVRIASG